MRFLRLIVPNRNELKDLERLIIDRFKMSLADISDLHMILRSLAATNLNSLTVAIVCPKALPWRKGM